MATKTRVAYIDDLTGEESEDVTSVEFGLDGVTYEIDLDEKNAAELRDTLAVYVEQGRRTGGRAGGRGGRKGTSQRAGGTRYNRETARQQRQWARQNGWPDIADRGRVPNDVVEAWEKAHPASRAA